MKKINFVIYALFATISLCSCKKENDNFPVEFKLKLLNNQGRETTVFNQTDTIVFELQVINHTGEELHLDNFVPGLICNSDTYIRVYSDKGTDYGRPCTPVCTDEGIFILQANQTRYLQLRWPSSINGCQVTALPEGNYITKSSYIFTITGGKYNGQRSAQLLNSEFQIK